VQQSSEKKPWVAQGTEANQRRVSEYRFALVISRGVISCSLTAWSVATDAPRFKRSEPSLGGNALSVEAKGLVAVTQTAVSVFSTDQVGRFLLFVHLVDWQGRYWTGHAGRCAPKSSVWVSKPTWYWKFGCFVLCFLASSCEDKQWAKPSCVQGKKRRRMEGRKKMLKQGTDNEKRKK
jgi:hypothetical protein